jgi:hypothetical protein
MTLTLRRRNRGSAAIRDLRTDSATQPHSPIPVAFKTPMSPRPLMAALDGKLTLAQAVAELRKRGAGSAADSRLLEQLAREVSGPHDYLAIGPEGELTKVDPEQTTLADIAVPRDVRTPRGLETTHVAGFEVQAYAPVGSAP